MKRKIFVLISIVAVLVLQAAFSSVCIFAEEGGDTAAVLNVSSTDFEPNWYDVYELSDNQGVVFQGFYFGTASDNKIMINVSLYGSYKKTDKSVMDFFKNLHAFIDKIDMAAHTQYETSDIYRFNNAAYKEELEISSEVYQMLNIASKMYEETDGAFDPAVYRLVDLWGFSSRTYGRNGNLPYDRQWKADSKQNYYYPLPDEKYISAFKQLCDFSKVVFETRGGKFYVRKTQQSVRVGDEEYSQWIDLGGIAKGYIAAETETLLRDAGFENFFVNLGGSSISLGKFNGGASFKLSLTDPYFMFSHYAALSLSDVQLSTSGQYLRNYTVDGVEYAHIIDGRTGRPAQTGIKTITVVGGDASEDDCLTTALTVMGRDGIVDFLNGDYVKEKKLKISLIYETADGKRQLLTNIDKSDFVENSLSDDYGFAIKKDKDGKFVYIAEAIGKISSNDYSALLIVLGCLTALCAAALIAYRTIKKRKGKALAGVENVKSDKPFKVGDIGVYALITLLITVLFGVFVLGDNLAVNTVVAADMATGEKLFVYNAVRKEYEITQSENWKVQVTKTKDSLIVTFSKNFGEETRFNVLTVNLSPEVSVKMTDSLCGPHKECVRNFPAVKESGGAIVCSPNGLKILTANPSDKDYIQI